MDDGSAKRDIYLTEKYFEEKLEQNIKIRSRERKFYQKIMYL